MVKLVEFYKASGDGWFMGVAKAQCDKDGDPMLPSTGTLVPPMQDPAYWDKLDFSTGQWKQVKKPTSCQEVIDTGLTCISNSPNFHDQEIKSIMEALVKADEEHFKTVISDDFVMTIEEIPEPTEEEKELEREQERQRALQVQIDELSKEMNKADLNGDEEWKADLRAEYARLIEEL